MNGRNNVPGYEIWKPMGAGSCDKPKQCSESRELKGGLESDQFDLRNLVNGTW